MTRTKRQLPTRIAVLGAVLLAALALPTLVRLAADWYWFQSVGFQTVFVKTLATRITLGLGAGLVAFAFVYANLRFAQRGLVPTPIVFSINPGDNRQLDLTRLFRRLAWPVALFLAFIVGASASGAWLTVLRFLHRTPFQITDPIFHRDVAYYVFTLPVVTLVVGGVYGLALLSLFLVLPLYLLRGDVVVRRRLTVEPSAQLHLGALIALLLALTAANIYLVRIPSLMGSAGGSQIFGATYADLSARLPLLRVSALVAALGAAAVLWGAARQRLVPYFAVALGAYVAVAAGLGTLVPLVVQRFSVLPNELVKETPQLRYHIAATRQAWGLDRVQVRDLSGEAALTIQDIEANQGTIRNVRLWDRDPLLQTFGQLQEIRTYYDFVSVDDDRYWIDGQYRQVLLSPRELNTASLPTQNFINERLTFTHGMGVTLSPVNQITVEGLPVLFVKDLPPASSVSLQVRRPAIYYGELSSDFVFVKTGQPEFDYPSGEDNTFAEYQGQGGVAIGGLPRRLILSAYFGSLKMLLSNDVTDTSRVLYHRKIEQRAAKALPFLRWDDDPYLVIRDDGTLQWILDAYTSSDRYPYAQPLGDGTNYLRNSAKVTIDAYDGAITAYVADSTDPLIQTYAKIFPGMLRPLDEMPGDLRAHIRYPQDLFRAQTALYTTYHMGDPEVFFHREDQWQIPAATRGDASDPYLRHIVMKLPGEEREEYIQMTPFTPRQKDNLAAWMVARNDGPHYGQIIVYRFPRQSLVFGPSQILNRINQNTEISQQVSLWDQRGSQVIRGNLLVIPIEESLIFVQALYLRAEGGRIPELKRVIVAYQNQVVMEETLEGSLARLFGGGAGLPRRTLALEGAAAQAPAGAAGPAASVADLIRQAAEHYDRAVAAQRVGDWATYGDEMRRVGDLLRTLRERQGPTP